MQLISEDYRELNKQLHQTNEGYGGYGQQWVHHIIELAQSLGTTDILDYGCGKGTLSMQLPYAIQQYDPAIPGKDILPKPADLVVCTDVLEHIEPDCLDSVLMHLSQLTKKCLFAVVHTEAASKTLADGRNAHLIQQPPSWWFGKFAEKFKVLNFMEAPSGAIFACEAK